MRKMTISSRDVFRISLYSLLNFQRPKQEKINLRLKLVFLKYGKSALVLIRSTVKINILVCKQI